MNHFISGMKTDTFKVKVDRALIRSFAHSIYNFDAIHHNLKDAKKEGFNDLVAPPTLPITFWDLADIYWLNNLAVPLIHGSQRFLYSSPITAGETFNCNITLKNIERKKGKKGEMLILEHVLEGYKERFNEECYFLSESTLILLNNKTL